MTVIMCEAGKRAYVTEIGNELKDMQDVVGGFIQAIYPYQDEIALICNEDGKLIGLPENRLILEAHDIIVGDFFLCGIGEEDFESIPEDLIEEYLGIMNKWRVR